MFFKKEITRKPVLNKQAEIKTKFCNSIEFTVDEISEAGIMNTYSKACALTEQEANNYDSIKINLGDAKYEITEPLIFDKKAKSGLPIIFTSAGALISGGKSFKGGFSPYKNGIYMRKLKNIGGFRQLYANEELCSRSCYPKKCGDYKNEYITAKWLEEERAIEAGETIAKDGKTDNIELIAIEKWTSSVVKIKSAAHKNGKTIFYLSDESASLFFDEQRSTKLSNPVCRVENSLDLLTAENEWYFDRKSQTLYFKPKKNTDINEIEFTVPVAENLIEVKQDSLYFENISFGYSNWDYPSVHGFAEVQATRFLQKTESGTIWASPKSAISVYCDNVHLNNCKIYNTGGIGVCLYSGNDFSITSCTVKSTGAGGISVGSFDEKTPSHKNILIANNTVCEIGRSYLGGVAILAGYTRNLTIDHNTVNDCGYTGISVGWGWGRESDMGNFAITNNRVSNIINNYLFDGAGLYLLGRQNDEHINIISGNYLEGGNGYAGLYFDEYSNNYIARDNVIKKGNKNGWFLLMHDVGYGLHNITVKHNLIETKKKFINSYQWKNQGERPQYKKSKPKKREVIVKENYTPKYDSFDSVSRQIIENSGVK